MFRFKHRLSKDIDLFTYDAQWLSLVNPRLNGKAASLAAAYQETANAIKITTARGDIDFIVAADVLQKMTRGVMKLGGRDITVDPPSEILAKKLFYRASMFRARDVYDVSAAIDLHPKVAAKAVAATLARRSLLKARLEALRAVPESELLEGIIPYDGPLKHGKRMVQKVIDFVDRGDPPVQAKAMVPKKDDRTPGR